MQQLRNVDLKPWHTLRADAQAASLLLIDTVGELAMVTTDAFVLGGGSNVIFVGDITRPLVHIRLTGREVVKEDTQSVYYRVAAGECWADVVRDCSHAGWYGLENLALIPGTVGAAPVQNIGAYGVEVAQVISQVQVYDRIQHCMLNLSAAACAFAYRHSAFKGVWQNRYIITHVTFALRKQADLNLSYPDLAHLRPSPTSPAEVCQAVTDIRQRKLPNPTELPNAGSFFHNPLCTPAQAEALRLRYPTMPQYPSNDDGRIKVSAAWCIEQCGFKGYFDGAVGMYAGHALVLVNQGGSGVDILRYAAQVQEAVYTRFGLVLQIEPTIVGDYDE